MQVNKINENELLCILTEEELFFDYDIEISDENAFKSENIKDKIVEIVSKAALEVDFKADKAISITANITQEHSLILRVTKENIKESKPKMKKKDKDKIFSDFLDHTYTETNREGKIEYVLEFKDFEEIFDKLPEIPVEGKSTLYKLKDKYYITLNSDNIDHYLYEWMIETKDILFKYFLEEHGQIIIAENAIEKLKEL